MALIAILRGFLLLVENLNFFNYSICKADAKRPVSEFCLCCMSVVLLHITRSSLCFVRILHTQLVEFCLIALDAFETKLQKQDNFS